MSEPEDERPTELETLEAIYGSSLIARSDYSGCLELSVALQELLQTSSVLAGGAAVSYLPRFRIHFELPLGYPDKIGPNVHLEVSWLPGNMAQELAQKATSLWEEYGRTSIMYAYASHLEEAAETAFGLKILEVTDEVQQQLLDYDREAKRQAFEKGNYVCGICLDPKRGSSCHQMSGCEHVFCVGCLQDYYNNAILTGDIDNVKCPDFESGGSNERTQRTRLITPRELLQIPIERPAVQRFVNLKRKRKLEADKDTIWCPRKWCQGAAQGNKHPKTSLPLEEMGTMYEDDIAITPVDIEKRLELPDETVEAVKTREAAEDSALFASRLKICEDCFYAFCRLCRRTWHGDHFDCRARINTASQRTVLEREEEASLAFIRNNTTKCPKCETPVQKSEACNHMTCVQCRTHFCYLCSTFLNPRHPYDHFNTRGSWCYQRLWEGQDGEAVE